MGGKKFSFSTSSPKSIAASAGGGGGGGGRTSPFSLEKLSEGKQEEGKNALGNDDDDTFNSEESKEYDNFNSLSSSLLARSLSGKSGAGGGDSEEEELLAHSDVQDEQYHPSWFLGIGNLKEMEAWLFERAWDDEEEVDYNSDDVSDGENGEKVQGLKHVHKHNEGDREPPAFGDFCVAKRRDNHDIYDLLYISQAMKSVHLVLKRVHDDDVPSSSKGGGVGEERKEGGEEHKGARDEAGKKWGRIQWASALGGPTQILYESIWDFVKNQKFLRKPPVEHRPYALIAVADKGNYRVQIFKYFWTDTEVYVPTIDFHALVGGTSNAILRLSDPVSVSYSHTGELAICDSQARKIYLLSPYLSLIKTIDTCMVTNDEKGDELLDPGPWPHWKNNSHASKQMEEIEGKAEGKKTGDASHHQAHQNQHQQHFKNSFLNAFAQEEKLSFGQLTKEQHPCSVSFSHDGKFAVGFKGGGLLLFNAYKTYKMGLWSLLPGLHTYIYAITCTQSYAV